MTEVFDTIVLGGGASGMASAISSSELGSKTLLIEKSNRLGKKVLASGNGRCNLMNTGTPKYYGNTEFAKHVIRQCSITDLNFFFRHYGLLLKEEKEGRVYPVTRHSLSVLNTLQNALKINHVEILFNTVITKMIKDNNLFICSTDSGEEFRSKRIIVCTGGAAQKRLGGSFDGYQYLQSMGHHLKPVFPSLVPVVTDIKSVSGLSGIRAHCHVSLLDGKKLLHQEDGEILFTDYGLSGICVMQCSRFINKKGLHFEIDLLSSVFRDPLEFLNEIKARQKIFAQFSPVALLEGILLPKLSFAVLKQAGIPLKGESAASLSEHDLERIVWSAYHYTANVIKTRTIEEAQVTAGGICSDEFDPHTMESRLVKGLFAAGEVLDIDGDCGGYNLMFAFASGLIAGGYRNSSKLFPEEVQ